MSEALRHMPAVDQVLQRIDDLVEAYSHAYVVARVRRGCAGTCRGDQGAGG